MTTLDPTAGSLPRRPVTGAPTSDAGRFSWMLTSFARDVPGVRSALAVSADGLALAASDAIDRETAERFAAVASGLHSLAAAAADCVGADDVVRLLLETDQGYLMLARIGATAALAVSAEATADLGQVAYEMALLADRAGAVLTPPLVEELKAALLVRP